MYEFVENANCEKVNDAEIVPRSVISAPSVSNLNLAGPDATLQRFLSLQ